jgi:Zn-dependent protease
MPSPLRHLPSGIIIATKLSKLMVLVKTVKFFKLAVSFASLLISLLAYGFTLGFGFAIGLMAMLLIHEIGHIIAARRCGLSTSLPMFIPFLGAMIFIPKIDRRDTEAVVAIGGPLLGSIGALLCFGLWYLDGQTSDILLLTSYLGIVLNLFNLLPLNPMDGGRITQIIGNGFKWVGLLILSGWIIYAHNPNLSIIAILVLDGFTLGLWLRPLLATVLWLGMIGLFLAGYGIHWSVDILDVLLGVAFILLFTTYDLGVQTGRINISVDRRPLPSSAVRLNWLLLYAALIVVLGGILMIQNTLLPSAATSG